MPTLHLEIVLLTSLSMQTLEALQQAADIARLLKETISIAVVGLSPKENRPSNMVGRYLIDAGYTIYPVNPGQKEILGKISYANLAAIAEPIDIVDIFRKSEDVLPIVEQLIELNPLPRAVWMQQGIINEAAAELARRKGVFVVMDRCIKVDHYNLLSR
jgi:predicted CoA-binding protein